MEELLQELGLSFECTQRSIVAGATFHWLNEKAWSIAMVGLGSNSKKATQRQVAKVWKVVWEMLKCTNIVEKYED
jgi:1,2-phenylacetyl-CoA epoxidase catalytic subunit